MGKNNLPIVWTQEQSDVLTKLVMTEGKSYAQAAILINEQFGTNYTRNSCIGRANRLGLQSPFKQDKRSKTIRDRPPKTIRARKPKEHKPRIKVVANGGGGFRLMRSFETDAYQLRCVEIVPRYLSLIDLEPNDCKYPYGGHDEPITHCGHPKMEGDDRYCVPHFHLCREERRKPRQSYFVRGVAA